MTQDTLRLLAFFLPQYHPIAENDAWWGKGFTEWTNAAKARPLFPGHYQPHLPADLGFYDLRLPQTRQAQADLARQYGISGFIYYHYWFKGKRLLERPFNEVLASGEPDFPFCLCWANENWSRFWDGQNREILMAQEYSREDDYAHIQWLIKAFQDKRYIRIGNKPLMLIYQAHALPDPLRTTRLWREEARKNGIEDLFLCAVASHAAEHVDPTPIGFDAAVEFEPDGTRRGPPLENPAFGDHHVHDYALLVQRQITKTPPPYPSFPGVTPGWDNSARRRSGATIFHGSTPQLYEAWLNAAIQRARQSPPDQQFVFINAWNEWAEGNHLEPDLFWGREYLEATGRAACGTSYQNDIKLGAELIARQGKMIAELERERERILDEFNRQSVWARDLAAIVQTQEQTLGMLSRVAGPFAKVVRRLRGHKP